MGLFFPTQICGTHDHANVLQMLNDFFIPYQHMYKLNFIIFYSVVRRKSCKSENILNIAH